MMTMIYQQPVRVLCWLGEHDEYVDLAYDTMDEMLWVTKVMIYQYWSNKTGMDIQELSSDVLWQLIDSEINGPEISS